MLRMQNVYVLRHQILIDGRSRRQVSRELGISRNTVRHYLEAQEQVYPERIPRRWPILDAVQPRLDALLSEWSERITPKQQPAATRLLQWNAPARDPMSGLLSNHQNIPQRKPDNWTHRKGESSVRHEPLQDRNKTGLLRHL